MRPRNTLLVFLVLAALGAYVYWVELPQEKRAAEQKRLLAFERADVTAVTLDYPDHAIALERAADGHWRITKPIEADADDGVVKNLVGAIADAQVTRTLDDVTDKLGSYGLETPETAVTLTLKDGSTLPRLKVGKTTQVGFQAYAQKGDDPKVYITAAALQNGLKKEVKDLRDKTVIAFDEGEVQKLEVKRPDGTVVIEREAEGDRWTLTAPARHPADPAEVRALLSGLRGIRVEDFASDDASADLGAFGLVSPRFTFSVWLGKDQAQKTLLIGGPHADQSRKLVYAKRAERATVYAIPDYALKNVDKDAGTLRDKTVLTVAKDKAAKIVLTRKDGAGFTLVKRDGAWHLDIPGEGAERGPTISRWVDDLWSLKGTEIAAEGQPDLAQYGLVTPDLMIIVSDEAGTAFANAVGSRGPEGGSDTEAKSYVSASGSGIVYGVKRFVYDRIDKRVSDFREPPATPVPSGVATPKPGATEDEELGADGNGLGGEDYDEDAGDEDEE